MMCGVTFFRPQALAAIALLAISAQGRDTWLEPERFAVTPGAILTLALTRADGFNGVDAAVEPAELARVIGRAGGETVTVATGAIGERTLQFSATLPRPAVAAFAVELKPRPIEREAGAVESYLRRIHASGAMRAAWEALPEPRRWRETTVTQAKTFVRVGEPPAAERGWAEPLGLTLEIVPERDPTALRAGDDFTVRVLRGGAPVVALALAFVSAGEMREHVVVTDALGRAGAPLEVAGKWLVHGTELRRSTRGDNEWDSDVTALVIDVTARAAVAESK